MHCPSGHVLVEVAAGTVMTLLVVYTAGHGPLLGEDDVVPVLRRLKLIFF